MNFVPEEHYRNRTHFPPAELAKFYGKEVAWSLDGSHIVASGDDAPDVCAAIRQSGLKSDEVVLAYVPFPEEMVLGGAWLAEGDEK